MWRSALEDVGVLVEDVDENEARSSRRRSAAELVEPIGGREPELQGTYTTGMTRGIEAARRKLSQRAQSPGAADALGHAPSLGSLSRRRSSHHDSARGSKGSTTDRNMTDS